MSHPASHVRTITTVLPRVGSRWMDERGDVLTVLSVRDTVTYSVNDGKGVGSGAISYFLSRHRPLTEDAS